MGGNNGTVDALAMTKPVQDMMRPHLVDIHPYDPVDPPDVLAKRTGLPEERIVKLNANENPYGGSPKVNEALANAPVHVLPRPAATERQGGAIGAHRVRRGPHSRRSGQRRADRPPDQAFHLPRGHIAGL